MKLSELTRKAGLLVPVFALRSQTDFGIGDTKAVRDAIDFCAGQGFGVLQILPIHETFFDHSPYNAISAYALSPALLSLTPAEVPGLTEDMISAVSSPAWLATLREGNVKYATVLPLKFEILRCSALAFLEIADESLLGEFKTFKATNAHWLDHYTFFRALIREYEGNPNWTQWRPEHQDPIKAEAWLAGSSSRNYIGKLRDVYAYVQWVAWRQWKQVRRHAEERGVALMGEMSFGVSLASADVWGHRHLFDMDWHVGSPPLRFFDTNKDSERWGQNWGLPAYNWDVHRKDGFSWLRRRIGGEGEFFHLCRIDHLRGYFRSYEFPWAGGVRHSEFAVLSDEQVLEKTGGLLPRFRPGSDQDAAASPMNERQGRELIGIMVSAAADMGLIGELMGEIPDYMKNVLDELHVANLTFPQLERDSRGLLRSSATYRVLSLASYANHDHAPLAEFYSKLYATDKAGGGDSFLGAWLRQVDWKEAPPATLTDELLTLLVKALFESPCALAVLMSSDLLGIPQRFNLPGSYGEGTWSERLEFPLAEYLFKSPYRERVLRVASLIRNTGRSE